VSENRMRRRKCLDGGTHRCESDSVVGSAIAIRGLESGDRKYKYQKYENN